VIAHDHTIDGNLVTINIYAVSDPMQFSFSVSELIGQLPAGLYDVEVLLNGVETILTTFTVFPYTPPSLIWDEDERLTDDDLSDSAPKSTWHDGEIHLLWNHSYDCMVRHGVFDSTGLHDLENIASCPTGSGPGVVSFEDTLFGFYAQGQYPVYNLFGKAIDPAAAQFQLTFGDDLYDRYGAAALIYEDALHLFWKRWVETGYRHVFHRTYDGQSWSDGVFVTEDYYFDTRPTAAVYNGEIYLFYLGGSQFRTFDGASWSDATLLFNGGDGNVTPAACTLNGFLFLLFRYDGQMYYKRFDGSEWTAARKVPSAPADEPRDLECIASEDELYLFWGSYYSWPRSELFAKRAVPEPNQMLFMATAIVVLAQLKRRRRTRS
jgi:hypothetical protein